MTEIFFKLSLCSVVFFVVFLLRVNLFIWLEKESSKVGYQIMFPAELDVTLIIAAFLFCLAILSY